MLQASALSFSNKHSAVMLDYTATMLDYTIIMLDYTAIMLDKLPC